jgi:acyl-CoA synthetase (AMP-forming)/AMP-acid ligase II
MAGYWNRSDASRDAIDEYAWLRPGDAARIDDEEFVWIADRVDDAYEVSGHIVYPGDVERVLAQHPAVADAGVVPRDGNGKGFVVLEADKAASEDELLEFCRARLAAHKVP